VKHFSSSSNGQVGLIRFVVICMKKTVTTLVVKFSGKEETLLEKILNINFYASLVAFILIFWFLLWYHYSWEIASLNSIAVLIVNVLLEKPIQKMNKNRKRYFPRWLWTIIVVFIFSILNNTSNFSKLELLWIFVLGVYIFKIIFPEKPEVE
jgi:hypothetical protein